jgi:hypothetical protein
MLMDIVCNKHRYVYQFLLKINGTKFFTGGREISSVTVDCEESLKRRFRYRTSEYQASRLPEHQLPVSGPRKPPSYFYSNFDSDNHITLMDFLAGGGVKD